MKIKKIKNVNINLETELCEIMRESGSDKSSMYHNYTKIYNELFKDMRNEKLNIFEMGIGSKNPSIPFNMCSSIIDGSSLNAWSQYFLNSTIYGADIDRDILYTTDKIKTFYCDQLDRKSVIELFDLPSLREIEFDIIIDDGCHRLEANINLLINSIWKLKKGGLYIIEDVSSKLKDIWRTLFTTLKTSLGIDKIYHLTLPHEKNTWDNNMIIIQK